MGGAMRKFFWLMPLLLSMSPGVKALDGGSFSCPQEVALPTGAIPTERPDWTVRPDKTPYLTGTEVFDGDPVDRVSLVPTSDRRLSKDLSIVTWALNGDFPRGKWVACRYEPGAFYLARRLPDAVSRCDVQWRTLKKARRGEVSLDFRCQ
jgi:hypothetical protein